LIETLASLALILVSVYLLSVITEGFFIVSLDQISRRLNLSDEVAGASLMAMGSSAPELAIALMALLTAGGAHSDVGIGAIVGSAVFNILVITGLSAVVAGGLQIHIFAVGRDIVYYLISILYLGLVFVDGHVSLIEAILGLVGYVGYMGALIVLKNPDPYAEDAPAGRRDSERQGAKVAGWHRLESLVEAVLRRVTGAPERNFVWAFIVSIALIVALSYALVESTIVFSAGIGIPPVIVALTLLAAGTSAPELMAAVDDYIPTPTRAIDQPFLMPIEDVFNIKGRGTVVTGRIERGQVNTGEEIEIVGIQRDTQTSVVTGVEMFRKILDSGEAGDNVGCLLRGIEKDNVERGQVLAAAGSITPHTKFEAEVYVLSRDEGGRHTPFFPGYRPQFYVRTTDVTGAIALPEGVEMVMPGDNITMTIHLINPVALEEGVRFAIREGGRTVGAGVVTKILE